MKKSILIILLFFHSGLWAVEGGFVLKDKAWDGVVHLKSSSGLCSGAIVGRQWVLTAAHCIPEESDSKQFTYSVYKGISGDDFVANASVHFIDSRYQEATGTYDVAVLKLDKVININSNIQLAPSKIYHHLLNGQYPPRKVLVAGYGLDENNQSGQRKGAFEDRLGLYPGKHYIGSFFTVNSIGETKPGDSGGPIFVLTPDGHKLFGVVSGENNYVIKDDDGDIKEFSIRNAPLASSLCLLDKQTQIALSFDNSYCNKIKQTEVQLSKPPESKEDHLWQAALAVASPLSGVENIFNDVVMRVAISLSKIDSIFARYFVKQNSTTISHFHREANKIISNALEKHDNKNTDLKDAINADSDIKISITKDQTKLEKCGEIPCVENFRVQYGAYTTQFKNLNWDFLTQSKPTNNSINVGVLYCGCYWYPDDNNKVVSIKKELKSSGLEGSFLGVTEKDDRLIIKGSGNNFSIDMSCLKEDDNYKFIRIVFGGKRTVELNQTQQKQLKKLVGQRKLIQTDNGGFLSTKEASINSININYDAGSVSMIIESTEDATNSILANNVFQCK